MCFRESGVGEGVRFLFTEKQKVSNMDINVMCHFANSLESRPCFLLSCPFMNRFLDHVCQFLIYKISVFQGPSGLKGEKGDRVCIS